MPADLLEQVVAEPSLADELITIGRNSQSAKTLVNTESPSTAAPFSSTTTSISVYPSQSGKTPRQTTSVITSDLIMPVVSEPELSGITRVVTATSSSPFQEKVSLSSPSPQLDRNSASKEEAKKLREMTTVGRRIPSATATDANRSPVVRQKDNTLQVDGNSLIKEEARERYPVALEREDTTLSIKEDAKRLRDMAVSKGSSTPADPNLTEHNNTSSMMKEEARRVRNLAARGGVDAKGQPGEKSSSSIKKDEEEAEEDSTLHYPSRTGKARRPTADPADPATLFDTAPGAVAMDGDGAIRELQRAQLAYTISTFTPGELVIPKETDPVVPDIEAPVVVLPREDKKEIQEATYSAETANMETKVLDGVKTNEKVIDESPKPRRKWCLIILILIFLIGGGVGAVIGLSGGSDSGGDGGDVAVVDPDGDTEATEASATSARPVLRSQLSYLLTEPSLFNNPLSPQGKSLDWLVSDVDQSGVTMDEVARLEARFALSVLYYTTNGDGWVDHTNFLSSSSECEWAGISCTSDGQVRSISLGKFFYNHATMVSTSEVCQHNRRLPISLVIYSGKSSVWLLARGATCPFVSFGLAAAKQ
jgi:hypothetical protein